MIADRPLQLSVPTPLLGVPIAANIDAQRFDDIKVYYGENLDGVAIIDNDYSMALAGDFKSFTITPLTGLITKAAGLAILIAFDPAILQTWVIPNSPRFPEGKLEQALDRLTLFARRLQERLTGVMRQRGGLWQGEGLQLTDLADGSDPSDAATVGQIQELIGEIASGAFANEALLVSYAGSADGDNVSAALDFLADALTTLSAAVDALTGGFLAGGLLTGAIDLKAWTVVDSAATADIGAVNSNRIQMNGVVTITSLGAGNNKYRVVLHNGVHQITAGASIIIPGGTRIAAVGDVSVWVSDDAALWRCLSWVRRSGQPLTALVADMSDMSANARSFNQAANYAAMRTALGLGALALLDFDALVYAGNSETQTSFPIGTVVPAFTTVGPHLAAADTIRLSVADAVHFTTGGSEAALNGTWRSRGRCAPSDDYYLYQRVA